MLKALGGLTLLGLGALAVTLQPFGPPSGDGSEVGAAPRAGNGASEGADLVEVVRRDVRVRLTVIGELRPTDSRTVSSALSGDQGNIVFLAEDGAVVEQGDELVRLDRAPYEDAARLARIEVSRREGVLALRGHALEWEKSQAKKTVQAVEFEIELADLERHRFELGEGPLEIARLGAESSAAASSLSQRELFVSELEPLLAQGFVQQAEIDQLVSRRDEAKRSASLAGQQADAYERFIFPSRVATLQVAQNRAAAALAQVQLGTASKVAEAQASVDLAERDLVSARARLVEAEGNLERTTILAPTSGMLVLTEDFRNGERRKPRIGDTVWQGQQIAFLPDLSQFEVRSRVREVDLHKIASGHEGMARVDAYPGLELKARVRGLGVLAERDAMQTGEKSFSVTIDLVGSDPRLRPGMTARVVIESGSAEDVLVIPLHALWEDDLGAWVWVDGADGTLVRRSVVPGLLDHHVVEILEGLEAGDRVSLVAPVEVGGR
ncbi:MAG: HlyD family secretion protein [Planctomycetota bacterium]|jgi:HlyD family secretion protein